MEDKIKKIIKEYMWEDLDIVKAEAISLRVWKEAKNELLEKLNNDYLESIEYYEGNISNGHRDWSTSIRKIKESKN